MRCNSSPAVGASGPNTSSTASRSSSISPRVLHTFRGTCEPLVRCLLHTTSSRHPSSSKTYSPSSLTSNVATGSGVSVGVEPQPPRTRASTNAIACPDALNPPNFMHDHRPIPRWSVVNIDCSKTTLKQQQAPYFSHMAAVSPQCRAPPVKF